MITRPEFCTKESVHSVLEVPDEVPGEAPSRASPSGRAGARVIRDVALGLFATGYLALVLFDGVESPVLSAALIILVARALVQAHAGQR